MLINRITVANNYMPSAGIHINKFALENNM